MKCTPVQSNGCPWFLVPEQTSAIGNHVFFCYWLFLFVMLALPLVVVFAQHCMAVLHFFSFVTVDYAFIVTLCEFYSFLHGTKLNHLNGMHHPFSFHSLLLLIKQSRKFVEKKSSCLKVHQLDVLHHNQSVSQQTDHPIMCNVDNVCRTELSVFDVNLTINCKIEDPWEQGKIFCNRGKSRKKTEIEFLQDRISWNLPISEKLSTIRQFGRKK